MKPSEFWELTPAEFAGMVKGYNRRQKNRLDELLYHAWHGAALSRVNKLPSLKSLMQTENKAQSVDDMLAMVKMLNAAFGGEEVEV